MVAQPDYCHADPTGGGDVAATDAQMWKNFRYFLHRVLPAAEAANVKLALHPPRAGKTGQGRFFRRRAGVI